MIGQSEVRNKIITMYLPCLTGDRPRRRLWWLPWSEYYFNTSFQSALKTAPFEVVYGREPPPMVPFTASSAHVVAVEHQLKERGVFLVDIRESLLQAQDHKKNAYDAHHPPLELQARD